MGWLRRRSAWGSITSGGRSPRVCEMWPWRPPRMPRTGSRRVLSWTPSRSPGAAEWNAHPRFHPHFANGLQQYEDLRPLYQAQEIANPADYLDQHIVHVTFFGHSTPAHDAMRAPLQSAENTLTTAGVTRTITSFWGFVPRRIAGAGLSNHTLSRAVDINPAGNPRIIDEQEILVIRAVTNVDLGQSQTAAAMRQASQDFQPPDS